MLYYEPSVLYSILKNHRAKVAILTDSNTEEVCLPYLSEIIKPYMAENSVSFYSVQAGEQSKTLHEATKIFEKLQNWEFQKKDLVLVLGGGMLCDLGSFCASIYKRGLRQFLIPTSLLAMCDAAIGGKTGVNLAHVKNSVGSFYPAEGILVLSEFIKTLPRKEVMSGFGEVIKHGILQSQKDFLATIFAFDFYKKHSIIQEEVLINAANFKRKIVEQDPWEKNVRKILNYGHTIGHALESAWLMEGKEIPHGICVLYGILYENQIAVSQGILHMDQANFIKSFISNFIGEFSMKIPSKYVMESLVLQDKKNEQDGINFSLIQDFGKPMIDIYIDKTVVLKALENEIDF